jgi:hypothetical protein
MPCVHWALTPGRPALQTELIDARLVARTVGRDTDVRLQEDVIVDLAQPCSPGSKVACSAKSPTSESQSRWSR